MDASFSMVNAAYPNLNVKNFATAFVGTNDHQFDITNVTINNQPVSRELGDFNRMLWPGRGQEIPTGFPPRTTLGNIVTSNDKWSITWQAGQKTRHNQYSAQYR